MEKKIEIMENGPYKVSGDIPLNKESLILNENDESIGWEMVKTFTPEEKEYYLCRCGHSKNFPFCDKTHAEINFDGTEVASKEPYESTAKQYRGEDMDLLDEESLCAGVRICLAHGDTWTLAGRSSDPEAKKIALEQVAGCSSGRLVAKEKDGTLIEPKLSPSISLLADPLKGTVGPFWVKGNIPITGADGEPYEVRSRVTLCCCGSSSNMPFCDRAHFESEHMKK